MATAIAPIEQPNRLSPTPIRKDRHAVSPARLNEYIQTLEKACLEDPYSADLRTCLGMAHAINFDVYRSMAALEKAIRLDAGHFFARFRYAEVYLRLGSLSRAENETRKALALAQTPWARSMAVRQMDEIRKLKALQQPRRPLAGPMLLLAAAIVAACVVAFWQ